MLKDNNKAENELNNIFNNISEANVLYHTKLADYEDTFFYKLCSFFYLVFHVTGVFSFFLTIFFLSFFFGGLITSAINENLISLGLLGAVALLVAGTTQILSMTLESITEPQYSERPTFIGKIKSKIKAYSYKKLVMKNKSERDMVNNINTLKENFAFKFNEEIYSNIVKFYKNNPYEFGTKENVILGNNYLKVKNHYWRKEYLELFNIYRNDKEKYCYDYLEKYY